MAFNFKTQLRAGQLGETLFLAANPDIKKNTDLHGDFLRSDGSKIELKSDFWSMDATPNLFIERYSDKAAKTPGGPFQSLVHGSNLFVYFFVPSLVYFTFDTKQLVGRLETILPTLAPVDIKNTSHVTLGYRVPRALVADIAAVTKLEVRVKP